MRGCFSPLVLFPRKRWYFSFSRTCLGKAKRSEKVLLCLALFVWNLPLAFLPSILHYAQWGVCWSADVQICYFWRKIFSVILLFFSVSLFKFNFRLMQMRCDMLSHITLKSLFFVCVCFSSTHEKVKLLCEVVVSKTLGTTGSATPLDISFTACHRICRRNQKQFVVGVVVSRNEAIVVLLYKWMIILLLSISLSSSEI
jgi:hypothetical protein